MFRFDVYRNPITVAGRCMDQPFIQPPFPHDLLGFFAMLVRVLFKIQIVEQTHQAPEVFFFRISQCAGKMPHGPFHRQGMAQVERVFIKFS